MIIPYLIGAALGLAVALFVRFAGFDRDRACYPLMLVVIASYYDLFAVMAGAMPALGVETLVFALFAAAAVIGFKTNLWIVAAALAGHGLFDFVRGDLIANPGVPVWWPMFCGAFDVVAGAFLAWMLARPAASGLHPARPAK